MNIFHVRPIYFNYPIFYVAHEWVRPALKHTWIDMIRCTCLPLWALCCKYRVVSLSYLVFEVASPEAESSESRCQCSACLRHCGGMTWSGPLKWNTMNSTKGRICLVCPSAIKRELPGVGYAIYVGDLHGQDWAKCKTAERATNRGQYVWFMSRVDCWEGTHQPFSAKRTTWCPSKRDQTHLENKDGTPGKQACIVLIISVKCRHCFPIVAHLCHALVASVSKSSNVLRVLNPE